MCVCVCCVYVCACMQEHMHVQPQAHACTPTYMLVCRSQRMMLCVLSSFESGFSLNLELDDGQQFSAVLSVFSHSGPLSCDWVVFHALSLVSLNAFLNKHWLLGTAPPPPLLRSTCLSLFFWVVFYLVTWGLYSDVTPLSGVCFVTISYTEEDFRTGSVVECLGGVGST